MSACSARPVCSLQGAYDSHTACYVPLEIPNESHSAHRVSNRADRPTYMDEPSTCRKLSTVQLNHLINKTLIVSPCVTRHRFVLWLNLPAFMSRMRWSSKIEMRLYTSLPLSPSGNLHSATGVCSSLEVPFIHQRQIEDVHCLQWDGSIKSVCLQTRSAASKHRGSASHTPSERTF